jgi:hypothetical protein
MNKTIFDANLELTKAYCHLQKEGAENNLAQIFRSYNPIVYGTPIFTFEVENYGYEIAPGVTHCLRTNWSVDPTITNDTIGELYNKQLNHKKSIITHTGFAKNDLGKIVVAEIDSTVIDGVSEEESQGLIDIYDLPPIDTWVYLEATTKGRLLYAFIPEAFVGYVDDAIAVNIVNCLYWLED